MRTYYMLMNMTQAIVTIKAPRKASHDPHNKKTGKCLCSGNGSCTDVTGQHHSFLAQGVSLENIERAARKKFAHVTRVEEVTHAQMLVTTPEEYETALA